MAAKTIEVPMGLQLIDDELDRVDAKLARLNERRNELAEKRRVILSQRWIEVNAVKKADVVMSKGDDVPYFLFQMHFTTWITTHREKARFFEWNECIFAKNAKGQWEPTDGYVTELMV